MSANCLVVDDSTTIRKVIGRMFEKMDFEVREAENGQVALESCLISMPEVIMLDWNMPVMSGIDFLRELRKTPGGGTHLKSFYAQPKMTLKLFKQP